MAAIAVDLIIDENYRSAKKEVSGYFQMKWEACVWDASTDLKPDYGSS